ncbi:hypothetical protein KKH82_02745 [Patescibacteria group bacterium]|nr:hypothetical protein [Patescibacteria group bacterium]
MKYKVDLEKLFNHIFALDLISFDYVLDQILALQAYKTAIKAGDKLSMIQLSQLVKEGFKEIDGMLMAQDGKSFFVKSNKKDLDKFFDR